MGGSYPGAGADEVDEVEAARTTPASTSPRREYTTTTTSHTNDRVASTDYETAWMLLANLGTHAPELLAEHDRDTISQPVDELAATVTGEQAAALFELDVTDNPQAVLVKVDRRLTRLLANTERPDTSDHLTRCKDLLATVRVR